jgi:hypothetical protein
MKKMLAQQQACPADAADGCGINPKETEQRQAPNCGGRARSETRTSNVDVPSRKVRREEAERERVAAAERARQEEKQREEQRRIAVDKAKQGSSNAKPKRSARKARRKSRAKDKEAEEAAQCSKTGGTEPPHGAE